MAQRFSIAYRYGEKKFRTVRANTTPINYLSELFGHLQDGEKKDWSLGKG
jgi:hypothetical protein